MERATVVTQRWGFCRDVTTIAFFEEWLYVLVSSLCRLSGGPGGGYVRGLPTWAEHCRVLVGPIDSGNLSRPDSVQIIVCGDWHDKRHLLLRGNNICEGGMLSEEAIPLFTPQSPQNALGVGNRVAIPIINIVLIVIKV